MALFIYRFLFFFFFSQAADASSGLSLRTIKSVSITIGPASGRRGAGWKDDRHPSTRHRHWANNLKIRGAKSIEVTEQDVAEDSSFALKCFQHTVLHQVISKNKKTKWYHYYVDPRKSSKFSLPSPGVLG